MKCLTSCTECRSQLPLPQQNRAEIVPCIGVIRIELADPRERLAAAVKALQLKRCIAKREPVAAKDGIDRDSLVEVLEDLIKLLSLQSKLGQGTHRRGHLVPAQLPSLPQVFILPRSFTKRDPKQRVVRVIDQPLPGKRLGSFPFVKFLAAFDDLLPVRDLLKQIQCRLVKSFLEAHFGELPLQCPYGGIRDDEKVARV